MTKKKRVIALLEKMGYTHNGGTTKYMKYVMHDSTEFAFIGNAGALRIGKSSTQSRSLTHLLPNLFKKYEIGE